MPDSAVWPQSAEPVRYDDGTKFTGHVEIRDVASALGTAGIQVNALYFDEGVRSRPHSHDLDQVLYFVEGPGVIAIDGGEDQLVEAGSFVMLPAGVPHMHGAPAGGRAAHVSLMPAGHRNDFACPIVEGWQSWRERPASRR